MLCASRAAVADRMEKLPEELEGVTLVQKLSAALPAASFTDEAGETVQIRDLISDKPIILSFNYSNCPMLCSVQLGGLVDTMLEMEWSIGQEYEVITISLEPKEATARSLETKSRYLERYRRPGAAAGWHFLTGSEENIRAVAAAVGFGYRYHPKTKEFLHPAVLTLISPEGKVSSYQEGVKFDPITLRDKLVVAGLGDVSQEMIDLVLSCYHYKPKTGSAAIATKVMRYGGLIFVVGFAFALAILRLKRSHEVVHVHQGSTEDHV